jgi:hypothetical protein
MLFPAFTIEIAICQSWAVEHQYPVSVRSSFNVVQEIQKKENDEHENIDGEQGSDDTMNATAELLFPPVEILKRIRPDRQQLWPSRNCVIFHRRPIPLELSSTFTSSS